MTDCVVSGQNALGAKHPKPKQRGTKCPWKKCHQGKMLSGRCNLSLFISRMAQLLEATLRGSRPGVQSASLIMTSLMTS